MLQPRHAVSLAPRRWLRYLGESVAVLVVLLCIFYRPILLSAGRIAARHFAAKANLKLDCRLEGSVFSNLIVRNLHITPTGPTIVESIDADYVRADYNLLDFLRYGASELVKNVEVRSANVVLNPATAAVKANVPPDEPLTLPTVFPYRLYASDVNVILRAQPQDFVLQGFNIDLDAKNPGTIAIAKLQLPTMPAWTHIAGATSYANRDLIINDLLLDDADRFRVVGIDASKIRQKMLGLSLDATLAGGSIFGTADLKQAQKSLETRAHFVAENLSLDTLRGYIGRREGELTGTVERALVDLTGVLDTPRSWAGTIAARLKELKQGGLALDNCTLAITAREGVARIDLAEVSQGLNKISLRGSAELPGNIREFGRSPAKFDVSALLPELDRASAFMEQPLTGAGNVNGQVEISNAQLVADLRFSGERIGFGSGTVGQLDGTFRATKQMPAPNTKKPYFADLRADVELTAMEIRSGEYVIDSARIHTTSVNDLVTFEDVETVRQRNRLIVRGDYRLPEDFTKAKLQPADVSLDFAVAELGDFFANDSPNKITGPLQLSGQVKLANGVADGELQLYGANLRARNLSVPLISGEIAVVRNVVYLNDVTAKLNERDFIGGSGVLELDRPYRYQGKLLVNIADLATLKPLLGERTQLAGALLIDWRGSGSAADFKNTGSLKLTLEQGRFANIQALRAKIDASYTPDALNVPLIFAASDKFNFTASLTAKGETLEISNIQLDQGQAKYASGYVSLPFIWSNLGSERAVMPGTGTTLISFESQNLDIKKVFDDFGQKPLASGFVSVKADVRGTMDNLQGRIDVQARELRNEMAKVEPATFDMSATLQDNRVAVAGKLQQAKVQPVSISADMPFDVAKIVREKKLDENTPLSAKVQLPRSSVNFVRQFVPAITQLDGDAALDVNVGGTIARPALSGSGDFNINVARFENPTLPALTSFKSRLVFDHDVLRLEQFGGQLAGGNFNAAGRITFPKLTEPNLDVQLKADSVLVARNDTVTARADANVTVTGPINAANVTGSVALTNSHLLKNLDLIPIGLPGRPAPRPPEETRTLTFPQPPVRDWKFDVKITTKDPFQIRGNLATGGAIVNLHLGGSGLQPLVEGQVRLEKVEATLPFSRLEIQYGYLHFTPDDPLNPRIDLQGTSLIRDYTIRVYVYGTANQPEAVFTSEPPLPQEEIISLLATGTTREELTGNNSVLAGKAAMLLVTQLYRKVFKKSGDAPPSNSVFNRLQVDVGNVDPRTGRQTASARFKASEHFVLLGQIEVGGDFRGQVQYILRFR